LQGAKRQECEQFIGFLIHEIVEILYDDLANTLCAGFECEIALLL